MDLKAQFAHLQTLGVNPARLVSVVFLDDSARKGMRHAVSIYYGAEKILEQSLQGDFATLLGEVAEPEKLPEMRHEFQTVFETDRVRRYLERLCRSTAPALELNFGARLSADSPGPNPVHPFWMMPDLSHPGGFKAMLLGGAKLFIRGGRGKSPHELIYEGPHPHQVRTRPVSNALLAQVDEIREGACPRGHVIALDRTPLYLAVTDRFEEDRVDLPQGELKLRRELDFCYDQISFRARMADFPEGEHLPQVFVYGERLVFGRDSDATEPDGDWIARVSHRFTGKLVIRIEDDQGEVIRWGFWNSMALSNNRVTSCRFMF